MRWGLLVTIFGIAFGVAGLVILFTRLDLSAVQQPGRTGEYLRTSVRRAVIRRRATRDEITAPPPDRETSMSLADGKMVFEADCASCHGANGHEPSPVGKGMLPRAVPLDSSTVQNYSDRELFSIVRDGIRFTGMPGFAGAETSDQIWHVVDYLRLLR